MSQWQYDGVLGHGNLVVQQCDESDDFCLQLKLLLAEFVELAETGDFPGFS